MADGQGVTLDGMTSIVERLRNEIACELYAQLPIRNETIEQDDVAGVAYATAVRLLRTFEIRWTPPLDEDDTVGPDAATFHGSVLGDARYPIFDWEAETDRHGAALRD